MTTEPCAPDGHVLHPSLQRLQAVTSCETKHLHSTAQALPSASEVDFASCTHHLSAALASVAPLIMHRMF